MTLFNTTSSTTVLALSWFEWVPWFIRQVAAGGGAKLSFFGAPEYVVVDGVDTASDAVSHSTIFFEAPITPAAGWTNLISLRAPEVDTTVVVVSHSTIFFTGFRALGAVITS